MGNLIVQRLDKKRIATLIGLSLFTILLVSMAYTVVAETITVNGCSAYTHLSGNTWNAQIHCSQSRYYLESHIRAWGSPPNALKNEKREPSYNSPAHPISYLGNSWIAAYITRHKHKLSFSVPDDIYYTSDTGGASNQSCWETGTGSGC